eukprot:g33565.t1
MLPVPKLLVRMQLASVCSVLMQSAGSGGEAAISSRPPVAEAELRPPRTPPRPRTPTRTVPPLAASERQRAESKRRSARDEWNVRQRFDLPAPLADEAEFRHYFNLIFPSLEIQLWDDNEEDQEPAAQQLLMAFRSADRDGDGFNYTMGYNVLTAINASRPTPCASWPLPH